jgi:hypothetical protein
MDMVGLNIHPHPPPPTVCAKCGLIRPYSTQSLHAWLAIVTPLPFGLGDAEGPNPLPSQYIAHKFNLRRKIQQLTCH